LSECRRAKTEGADDEGGKRAGGQTIVLSGTGTVTATAVALSPKSLSFGNEPVGTSGVAQTITLSNAGSATLNITSLAIAGANAGDFAQNNTCGGSVVSGASCTISVMFKPTASGNRTASVNIADNAGDSPQTATLTGTGTSAGAGATLSPTSLSFGNQGVDTNSAPQTVTLSNSGGAPLSITSLAIAGTNASDFSEIANTCGSSLASGGNCTIEVMFTPSAVGQRTATLNISDNASGSPQAAILTGTGSSDVSLSWVASPTSGVTGYNVYRGTTSGGESSTPLNSTPINGTSYVDENVTAGITYYYVVTAVGSDGVQSASSNESEATVPTT
jgi:hypothetical protein